MSTAPRSLLLPLGCCSPAFTAPQPSRSRFVAGLWNMSEVSHYGTRPWARPQNTLTGRQMWHPSYKSHLFSLSKHTSSSLQVRRVVWWDTSLMFQRTCCTTSGVMSPLCDIKWGCLFLLKFLFSVINVAVLLVLDLDVHQKTFLLRFQGEGTLVCAFVTQLGLHTNRFVNVC